MLQLRIKYLSDIKEITISDNGDWIDLRCAETVELEPLEYMCLPLGICVELPKGYSAIIAPRSSTFKKWGILQVNSPGIIDESYCGDNDQWYLPVIAMRKTVIYKNDRICQFRLIKKTDNIEFFKTDVLGNKDRGGLGSTGRN